MLTLAQLLRDIKTRTPVHQRWMVDRVVHCTLLEFPDYVADPARETLPDFAVDWLIQRVCGRYRERYGNPLLVWLIWTVATAAVAVIVQKVIEWWIDHHETDELIRLCEETMEQT